MNFIIESKKDLTIFRLQEKRLDASIAPELKSQILMLVAEGKKYLIIDLAQVDAIDSSGIGALLIAHRHTAEMEGFAAFIGIHGHVKDLLQMMQLHKQLYIFSSVQEVLRNLEEVDDIEETTTKKVEDDDNDEDLEVLAELDDVALASEDDLDLGEGELEVPEFSEEGDTEFSDKDDKPKKRGKTKKNTKPKSPRKSKKSAPKAKKK